MGTLGRSHTKIRTTIKNDKINWYINPTNVTAVALWSNVRNDVRQKAQLTYTGISNGARLSIR
jgi:hypothetical protein